MATVGAIILLLLIFFAGLITLATVIGCLMWIGSWILHGLIGWLNET